jgi:hypothetical protein
MKTEDIWLTFRPFEVKVQFWGIPFQVLSHAKISRGFVKNHLNITSETRVAKNHTKTLDNLVIYWLNIIETDFILGLNNFIRTFLPNFCRYQACNPNFSDVMHIVERLTTGSSDVIVPIGVASPWRRRIISDFTSKLWVLNFWIKYATIRAQNASRCSHLVSCDKQKMALMCFLSGNITLMVFLARETHSTVTLIRGFLSPGNPFDGPRKPRVWSNGFFRAKKTTSVIFPLKKHTRVAKTKTKNKNLCKDTWHNTQVFDLTYFSRSQR